MRTATLPAVRVTPETRSLVESVLREGETLSTFIEDTVRERAQWRKEDEAFYARAMAAAKRLDESGKSYTLDETIASLRAQIQRARERQTAHSKITATPIASPNASAAPRTKGKAAA